MRCIACTAGVLVFALVWMGAADLARADDYVPGYAPDGEYRLLSDPPAPPPPPTWPADADYLTFDDGNGDPVMGADEPLPPPPVVEGDVVAPPTAEEVPPPPPIPGAPPPMPEPPSGAEVWAPDSIVIEPCPPAPCPEPCPPAGCLLSRDDCGWSLDWCGNRYGCFEIHLEGSYSLLEAPEGPFGLPAIGVPDQIEWDVLDYEGEFGGRGTVRIFTDPQEWIEARFAYYGSWDDEARDAGQFGFFPGPAGLGQIDPVGGISAPNAATLYSESEIWSAELSYVTELACKGYTSWTGLIGFRWVQFDELVRADNWALPFAPFTTPPFAQSDVDNQFLGLQIGVQGRYEISPRFDVLFSLKGLVGNLNRDIEITDRSFFAGGTHNSTSEDDEIVLGGDLDVTFRLRVTPRVAVTAGYNLLILDNVVRAHQAMDFTKSTTGAIQPVHTVDQLVLHTFLLGLHLNF